MKKQSGKALVWIIIVVLIVVGYFMVAGNGSENEITYDVTVTNTSATQPLSPGVYVVHEGEFSLDFEGEMAPGPLEPLAEYGNPGAFAKYVEGMDGVEMVVAIADPILPGESFSFVVNAELDVNEPVYLSGIQMAVASNDGYALLDSLLLDGTERAETTSNFDAGTEENSFPGSGFAGGQPDPARGEENVENGTPTDEVVKAHDQLTTSIMSVTVVPRIEEMEEEMTDEQ